MRILFTVTVFCSAFMLFLIEPIAAKMLLPTFGGSASVWTASMVFFQVALLGGYAYADWLSRQQSKWIGVIHAVVIGGAEAVLSASVYLGWVSRFLSLQAGTHPSALAVALALTKLLGLVFLVIAASSPILQRAFGRTKDPRRNNPYFLYAASNAGSLIALLAYPVVIEPFASLSVQFSAWIGMTKIVLLATIVCLVLVAPRTAGVAPVEHVPEIEQVIDVAPSWRDRFKWLGLAAVPSSLLLGVITFLTTSVAPIPLLWVVPLTLYLLTFIIAFAHKPRATAFSVGRWTAILATPLALALILESATPIIPLALFHLATVFTAMLACHLRLSESRPSPKHLTEFFLWMAAGGALGGLFNALIAPRIFTTLFEYPLALGLCCALAVVKAPSGGKTWGRLDWAWPAGIGLLTAGLILVASLTHMAPSSGRTILTIGIPAVACFAACGRPIRFGLSLVSLFAVAAVGHVAADGQVLYGARSFYGVHRVVEDSVKHLRKLVHGNTVHGIQSTLAGNRDEPLTYYSKSGPAGSVFRAFKKANAIPHIGFIGLGIGSLAAYGETGQQMTYFEIDPVVIHVATDPKLFTFLADSKANVRVVEGDGRLTVAQEPNGEFGLLVLDAFTSDSIPVHILTEEAIKMYLSKLDEHGFLLFHVSNNYLDLAPVLAAEARDLGLISLLYDDTVVGDDELKYGKEASRWMILARNRSDLGKINRDGNWQPSPPAKRGWTDDRSDILSAFVLRAPRDPSG